MTSADAASPWNEERLAGLHRVVLRELLRLFSPPPGAEGGGAGRPVRGGVRPPGLPDTTRVVPWDGHDPDTSLGYDLPLVDRTGAYEGGSPGIWRPCPPSYAPSSRGTSPGPRTRTARRCTTSPGGEADGRRHSGRRHSGRA
ncbi:hypothetical protein OG749_08665 [Streptomyces nojiriensis]|uniref:hypothetical protein n=1 Tax=Streptomyces nojiriensis TaxID=66374 RepID=UPI002E17E480